MIIHDKQYYKHLVIQTCSAAMFIFAALFALSQVAKNDLVWAAGASTLASSAFAVFILPDSLVAQAHRIVGGYIIAIILGCTLHYLASLVSPSLDTHQLIFRIAAMISVAGALVAMSLLNWEHPPAAGLAVIMVVSYRHWDAILVIFSSACFLALVQFIFKKHLYHLAD